MGRHDDGRRWVTPTTRFIIIGVIVVVCAILLGLAHRFLGVPSFVLVVLLGVLVVVLLATVRHC